MGIKTGLRALAVLGALLLTSRAWASPPLVLEVDFHQVVGEFNALSGVQGSPYPIAPGDVEHSDAFRRYSVQLCRFPQDCMPNTLTLSGIFPQARADPEMPSSYRFQEIDHHIRSARVAGCEILWQTSYDVGGSDSWQGINLGGRAPQDLDLWGRVVTRCLEHFNHGWSDGMDRTVEYVEFVNEPDGLGGFKGAQRPRLLPAFLHFLRIVEEHNRRHPDFPVTAVGPGIPLSWDAWASWKPGLARMLKALRQEGHDLGVFSFHTYGKDTSPQGNRKLAQALRAELDAHGFAQTRLMNSEWQGGDYLKALLGIPPGQVQAPDARQVILYRQALASYAVACKIGWQGSLDKSCYYLAKRRCFPPNVKMGSLGLDLGTYFPAHGPAYELAEQEKLLVTLAQQTPLRCWNRDLSPQNLFALALRSKNGQRKVVLLCNLSLRARTCHLRRVDSKPVQGKLYCIGKGSGQAVREQVHLPSMTTCWLDLE